MTYSINSLATATSFPFSTSSFDNSQRQAMTDFAAQEKMAKPVISNLTAPFSPQTRSNIETAVAEALNSLISSSSSMSSSVSSSSSFSSSSFSGFPLFLLGLSSSAFNSSSVFSAFPSNSSFRSISSQNSAFSSKKILKAKRCTKEEERIKISNISPNVQNNDPVFKFLKNKYKASFEKAQALEKEKKANFMQLDKILDDAVNESTECEAFLEENAKTSLSSLNYSEEMGKILFDRGNMYLMQGGDSLDLSESDLQEASQLFEVASNTAKINECNALIKIVQEKKALFAKEKHDVDIFLTKTFDKILLNDMQTS